MTSSGHMRVAIAGGHGQVALRLARLLDQRGDEVHSLIRRPEHADEVREHGGQPVVCDLESADVADVAEAIAGDDAVVFAAGAGPGSGAERKETMDYGGAAKLIAAAQDRGVGRYLMVSAMGADPDRQGDDTFSAYVRAKGRADAALRESGLDHTIVRPGRLTNDPGTGRVEAAPRLERSGSITRDDTAAVLVAALDTAATIGLAFEVLEGETPIAEAIAAL